MSHDDLFGEDNNDGDIVFRDIITLALCGFVSMVVMIMPHLNPPAQAAATDGVTSPGNVIIEIKWPDGRDADVDLWVQAPGDVPVGYSNKGGAIFNLLRDDLGRFGDPTNLNYEISYSRGLPPGEYAANVHLYRNADGQPVDVEMTVSVKATVNENARPLLATTLKLRREGEELTGLRFKLDAEGNLVANSTNNLFKQLRSGTK